MSCGPAVLKADKPLLFLKEKKQKNFKFWAVLLFRAAAKAKCFLTHFFLKKVGGSKAGCAFASVFRRESHFPRWIFVL